MWAFDSVFYQIYPLGFCGAPFPNEGQKAYRLKKVKEWIPHMKKMGINAVYFSPVFESDNHGYDTRDYFKIDCRLGTNANFKTICKELHKNNIKVVLDGVFNHVGRGFWAFKDVQEKKWESPYKDWFNINFDGNSCYNDGFWYEGWEGHYELVKLNLWNDDVVNHIFSAIKFWVDEFDIDGLRLDVAYCLDKNFLRRLHDYCNTVKPDFFLLGELLHGDYNQWVNDAMLHSATNYECYKGLYSSFNSMNMFEIVHSLMRQFGPEQWTLYKGKHLLNFVDNHDVTRVATILQNKQHLPLIFAMQFGMPGIPCIYYGSEWGAEGDKNNGDLSLRPCFDKPIENDLTAFITKLIKAHKESKAIINGDFKSLVLTNKQCIFKRQFEDETVLVAVNAEENSYWAGLDYHCTATDLISGDKINIDGGVELKPYSAMYLKI